MPVICQHYMDTVLLAVLNLLTFILIPGIDGDIYVKNVSTNHTIERYSDMQSNFGQNFPIDGLEGWLVYASPDRTACSPVDGPPINGTYDVITNKYILLIARGGNCEFSDKILTAQNSGYHAAIMHNFPGNNSEVEMQSCSNGSLVDIPSTFVGYSDGMELWQYNYTHRKYIIKIIEDDTELKLFLWPFAVVVGVCFVIFVIFMLVKLLRDHASKKRSLLSKKNLKKIPVRKFKKGDYYDTCAICLDEYEEGEKIRVLPCDHVYHMKCIDPWLTKNKKTCPVCKRRVIPGKDANSDDSGSEAEDGQASTGGSENTPLLSGNSAHPRSQSHGSVSESTVLLNPTDPVVQSRSQGNGSSFVDGRIIPTDLDLEHGAVGGEGISDRTQQRHTLLSLAASSRGNIQMRAENSDANREKKQRKEDHTRTDNDDDDAEEEDDDAGLLLGFETRTEHRHKRKLRNDKKKLMENRQKQGNNGTTEINEEVRIEAEGNTSHQEEVNIISMSAADPENLYTRVGDEGEYDNQSFLEIPEVVVPDTGPRRALNNVV